MEEIVRVLLQEGIDEETIHEVLDVITERKGDPSVGEISNTAYHVLDQRIAKKNNSPKDEQRFRHAEELANLPLFTNTKYKDVLGAAKKVDLERGSKALKLNSTDKDVKRAEHASNIVNKK